MAVVDPGVVVVLEAAAEATACLVVVAATAVPRAVRPGAHPEATVVVAAAPLDGARRLALKSSHGLPRSPQLPIVLHRGRLHRPALQLVRQPSRPRAHRRVVEQAVRDALMSAAEQVPVQVDLMLLVPVVRPGLPPCQGW